LSLQFGLLGQQRRGFDLRVADGRPDTGDPGAEPVPDAA